MAENSAPEKKSGWLKALATSAVGLFSGAVLMYVSPLVNTVIKPGKPIANFSHQADGLVVKFQNRSTGGTDGWWDFGDGSALEPFSASQDTLSHAYPRPGTYTAKLLLRNFLGEENERSVSINVDGSSGSPPVIEAFQVVPLKPDNNAPATFRLVSRIKNADLCIWSLGDDRPLDVSSDNSTTQERLVTIKEAGYYTLRLVAVAGKQTAEKAETVFVAMGDNSLPTATLQVTFDATRVQRENRSFNISVPFPAQHKESTYAFKIDRPMDGGLLVVDAKFAEPVNSKLVKNAKLEITPDKTSIRVSGELVKSSSWVKNTPLPTWTATIKATVEHRFPPTTKKSEPVVANLNVPGTTQLLLPKLSAGWEITSRTLNLELREGASVLYRGTQLPVGAAVQIKGRPHRVTAVEAGDYLQVQISDLKKVAGAIGN